MPYPTPFVRLTIIGHFGAANGAEVWSTNCKIDLSGGTTDPTDFLVDVATDIATFWGSTALNSGSLNYLTELHGAVIGTDGKYVGGAAQATKIFTYVAPVAGSGSNVASWATATVLSLRSSTLGRGPGSHGRMYWPSPAQVVSQLNGRYTPTVTANLAAAAKTMFLGINAAAAANFGSGSSVINSSPVGAGVKTDVDRILVGDKPDHIERRENATPELYASIDL